MKVAMISKSNHLGGGASKVAEDLCAELKKRNFKVDHFTRSKHESTIPLYTEKEKKIYHRLLDLGIQEYYPFEKKVIKKHDNINKYDIFHFHDITATISPLTIKHLSKKNKKIIWTIHDCSIVTGGCIYPLDCTKYKNTCINCPQLGSFGLGRNVDLTFLFHLIKKNVLKNSNIYFVAPSKWIADLVYETGYIENYPHIIPNGIDTEVFRVHKKEKVREELSLPKNRFIILISSANLQNKFKGIKYALEVIQELKEINPYILVIGKETIDIKESLKEIKYKFTGFIDNNFLLNKYYASADIFLNTTIADNHPLTVLECMASGTPNIGFATGGIKEIVQNNVNGYVVEKLKIKELVEKIKELTTKPDFLKRISENAMKEIQNNYSLANSSKKYTSFYDLILSNELE